MALKKKNFSENEIAIFEDACIYKRGEYWHFRMWLAKEKRYVRRSLKTTSRATAVELAKDTYLDFYANLRQGKHSLVSKRKRVQKNIWKRGERIGR